MAAYAQTLRFCADIECVLDVARWRLEHGTSGRMHRLMNDIKRNARSRDRRETHLLRIGRARLLPGVTLHS